MITAIVIIVVVIILIIVIGINNSSPTPTEPNITTGNLNSKYENFFGALDDLYPSKLILICDDNKKLIYRLFQTSSSASRNTGEFLFILQLTARGHEVSVTFRGGPKAKLYKSTQRFFSEEQTISTYKTANRGIGASSCVSSK